MKPFALFAREIRFRPVGFLTGLIAATAVAGCLVGSRAFLEGHDRRTDLLVYELETRAAERMAKLQDEARIFSKNLGFNILLLPPGQDAGDFYSRDTSTAFFTNEQAHRLASAELATLNHLLPMLRERVRWDAYGGDVIVMGIEGEIYIKAEQHQKPIEEAVEAGRIHLGHALHKRLGANVGDAVDFMGRRFVVHRLLPEKANIDDISVLMNLGDAQQLLNKPGKVSGVLALSCDCAAGELDPIRMEVARVLDGVQVIEFSTRAQARQRARQSIDKGAREEMRDIVASRGALRRQLASFAALLVALVSATTLLLLCALAAANSRERRSEVALLRALGLGTAHIAGLFLEKALLTGLAGGVFGCLAGLLAGGLTSGGAGVAPVYLLQAVGLATAAAVLASVIPAWRASREDPAVILNQE